MREKKKEKQTIGEKEKNRKKERKTVYERTNIKRDREREEMNDVLFYYT